MSELPIPPNADKASPRPGLRLGMPRAWFFMLLLLFVLSRLIFLFGTEGRYSDTRLYHAYFERFEGHRSAGSSFFEAEGFEYPPLMLAVVLAPGYLAGALGTADLDGYRLAFRGLMSVMDLLVFLALPFLLFALLPKHKDWERALRLALWLVLPLTLPNLVYDRLDLPLAAMMTLSFAALVMGRFRLGAFGLGLAVALKLTPLILFVPLAFWAVRPGREEIRRELMLFAAFGLLAGFAPFSLAAGSSAFQFVSYQAARGLQIESVPASLGLFTQLWDWKPMAIEEARAISLIFPYAEVFARVVSAAGLLCGLAFLAQLFNRRSRLDGPQGLGFTLNAAVALFCLALCFSKVFSPQYLLWLLPLVLTLDFPIGRFSFGMLLFGVVLVLSAVLFPEHYRALVQLKLHAQYLLLARNGIFVVFAVLLWRELFSEKKNAR